MSKRLGWTRHSPSGPARCHWSTLPQTSLRRSEAPADSNDSSKDLLAQKIIKHWCPLFDKYQVTAVFENDHHTYKRTHPLLNNQIRKRGIVYLGDGCWGVDTRAVPKRASCGTWPRQRANGT